MRRYISAAVLIALLPVFSCSKVSGSNSDKSNFLSLAVLYVNTPRVPVAPTNLQLIVESSSQLNLSWRDNSNNETEFRIERSDDNVTFSEVGTAASDTAVYNDAGLPATTTCYYRVRALNSVGASGYSNVASGTTFAFSTTNQIIADHTVVARYDNIPAIYMTEVKKMMVAFPGESHSEAYRRGMELLQAQNAAYVCNVDTGEAPTDLHVRVNYSGAGEANWFTWYAYDGHAGSNMNDIKDMITEYADHGHPMHALGFGWCWDTTWMNDPTDIKDPVYGCGWAGSSVDGPDGNRAWGLDASDYAITGNRVSLDTYLGATEDYRIYCLTNSYPTKVIFTTSPADGNQDTENGYQRYLKHERIRSFVRAHPDRILFDYSDILCYDDDGTQNTGTWSGHTFPHITDTNAGDGSVGHIGPAGAIRLAKAQWWMLARIAGWDGVTP